MSLSIVALVLARTAPVNPTFGENAAISYRIAAVSPTSGSLYLLERKQGDRRAKTTKLGRAVPEGMTVEHAAPGPDGRTVALLAKRAGKRYVLTISPTSPKAVKSIRPTVAQGEFLASLTGSRSLFVVGSTVLAKHSLSKDGGIQPTFASQRIGGDASEEAIASPSPDGRSLYVLATQSGQDWSTGKVWLVPASGKAGGRIQALPVREGVQGLAFVGPNTGVVAAWNQGLVPFARDPGTGSVRATGDPVSTPSPVVSLVGNASMNRGLVSTRSGWLGAFTVRGGKLTLQGVGNVDPFAYLYAAPTGGYVVARSTERRALILDWRGKRLDDVTLPEPGMLLLPLR